MQAIKTLNDIHRLEAQKAIPRSLSRLLQTDFKDKAREAIFSEETPDPDFDIAEYGYLVLLESGDRPDDWAQHGFNLSPDGIRIQPEYAEIISSGGKQYYRIVLYADNDNVMQYYSEVGIHSPTIENWFLSLID